MSKSYENMISGYLLPAYKSVSYTERFFFFQIHDSYENHFFPKP